MIETIFLLGILLISAKLLGELTERMGLPAIFGEIGVGIIACPLLGIIKLEHNKPPEILELLGGIGAVFLLFSIGFTKVEIERLSLLVKKAIPVVLLGAFFPFIAGFTIVFIFPDLFFENQFQTALLLGTALASTSIGVSLRTLMDLRYIATAVGSIVLLAAVLDNIFSLCIFGFVIKVIRDNGVFSFREFAIILISLGGFIGFLFLFVRFILPQITRLINKMIVDEALFCLIIGGLFLFVYITEKFGFSYIIGAFLFGVALSSIPRLKTEDVVHKVNGIGGFFIPFFFINIGLVFEFGSLSSGGYFGATLVIALIIFQIAGGFIAGKIIRFSNKDSFIIGIALIPRNELALVITSIGFGLGLFGKEVFSSLILLAIISTLITPFLFKLIIRR